MQKHEASFLLSCCSDFLVVFELHAFFSCTDRSYRQNNTLELFLFMALEGRNSHLPLHLTAASLGWL